MYNESVLERQGNLSCVGGRVQQEKILIASDRQLPNLLAEKEEIINESEAPPAAS